MLEELAKKDKQWRRIALRICNNSYLADDIVQEMYIRLHDCKKEINDFYVVITMRNIFLANLKKDNLLVSLGDHDIPDKAKVYEYTDKEKELIDSLKWYEKELIEMSYDKSFHEIQRELNINYQFVRRILNKTKDKWQDQKAKD